MYDYGLGGKNHFAADRAAFDAAVRSTPTLRTGLRENRRFDGLELVPPGVVVVSEWRPGEDGPRPLAFEVNGYGGAARKG